MTVNRIGTYDHLNGWAQMGGIQFHGDKYEGIYAKKVSKRDEGVFQNPVEKLVVGDV